MRKTGFSLVRTSAGKISVIPLLGEHEHRAVTAVLIVQVRYTCGWMAGRECRLGCPIIIAPPQSLSCRTGHPFGVEKMEQLLQLRHQNNIKKNDQSSSLEDILLSADVKASFLEFARAVRKFSVSKEIPVAAQIVDNASATIATSSTNISASWLLDQCYHIPSSLIMGGPLPLALSIHEACTKYTHQEAELQTALFELIGMECMEFLLELVQNAATVAKSIQTKDLKRISGVRDDIQNEFHNKEHEKQILREEALEALNAAAIAKAQADSITSRDSSGTGSSATHSVFRTSDQEILKAAKRAAKRAAAAVTAAREAGVIIDEHMQSSLDRSTLHNEAENFETQKGLAGMTGENLRAMKSSLLPEGSKFYYESKGLPTGTTREFGEGYEKVIIPPRIMDESKRRSRIKITDVMNAAERKAFEGTEYLNPMQSAVFETAFRTQEVCRYRSSDYGIMAVIGMAWIVD